MVLLILVSSTHSAKLSALLIICYELKEGIGNRHLRETSKTNTIR